MLRKLDPLQISHMGFMSVFNTPGLTRVADMDSYLPFAGPKFQEPIIASSDSMGKVTYC